MLLTLGLGSHSALCSLEVPVGSGLVSIQDLMKVRRKDIFTDERTKKAWVIILMV